MEGDRGPQSDIVMMAVKEAACVVSIFKVKFEVKVNSASRHSISPSISKSCVFIRAVFVVDGGGEAKSVQLAAVEMVADEGVRANPCNMLLEDTQSCSNIFATSNLNAFPAVIVVDSFIADIIFEVSAGSKVAAADIVEAAIVVDSFISDINFKVSAGLKAAAFGVLALDAAVLHNIVPFLSSLWRLDIASVQVPVVGARIGESVWSISNQVVPSRRPSRTCKRGHRDIR